MRKASNTADISEDTAQDAIVKPLSLKIAQEGKNIERLLRGLLLAFQTEEDLTRRAIADRLRDVEGAVEILARELVRSRKGDEDGRRPKA